MKNKIISLLIMFTLLLNSIVPVIAEPFKFPRIPLVSDLYDWTVSLVKPIQRGVVDLFSVRKLSIADECSLILPTWGYYECSKSPNPITPVSNSVSVTAGLGKTNKRVFTCNYGDVDPLGFQSPWGASKACRVRITQATGNVGGMTYSCSQTLCKDGTAASGSVGIYNTYYLKFGESIEFTVRSQLFGTTTLVYQYDYYQKTIHKKTWTGYKTSEYPGCDENSVRMMSSRELDMLPQGSVTSLNIGNRINFIDTYIDVPIIGNYWNHPTYGSVVCSNNRIYRLERYKTATAQGEEGKFVDTGGNCYYIMSTSSLDSCECSPGMTIGTMTCDNLGHWVDLDKGVCVRGGIASDQLCPGAGLNVVDLQAHTVTKYKCNPDTGTCDSTVVKSGIECNPSTQQGCSGVEYCGADYMCHEKTATKIACPYGWCKGDPNYFDKDCDAGLQACPTVSHTAGDCLQSCAGIEPPVPAPPISGVKTCYENCKLEHRIRVGGVDIGPHPIMVPICKVRCNITSWVTEKKGELVVGFILAILVFLTFGKYSPQFAMILAVLAFIVTLYTSWTIGAILLFVCIGVLLTTT